jgi:hypothetical protein
MSMILSAIAIGGFILFIVFIAALWTYHDIKKKEPGSESEDSSRDKSVK